MIGRTTGARPAWGVYSAFGSGSADETTTVGTGDVGDEGDEEAKTDAFRFPRGVLLPGRDVAPDCQDSLKAGEVGVPEYMLSSS